VTRAGKARTVGNTCLFTYGFSFSDNDKHIYDKIATGRIKHLFVSLYGDPESEFNQQIIEKVNKIKGLRTINQLEVTFYDAESASVWE
jgi:hypothetical protein